MQSAPLSYSFTLSPDDRDWISANWLVIRHRWLWRRLTVAFAIIWLIYSAMMLGIDYLQYGTVGAFAWRTIALAAIYALVVVAIVVITTIYVVPRRVRKQVADVRRLVQATQITIDADGFRTSNTIGNVALQWSQLKRWLENSRVVALMPTDREMIVVPKTQIEPDAIAAMRQWLSGAVSDGKQT